MPASRATSTTPPFFSRLARTSAIAAGAMRMRPRATASRVVTGLGDTSTMRAAPFRSKWLKRALRTVVLQEAAEQHGLGRLAALGLLAPGLEHDERVGARVRHEVARAGRAQAARHEPAVLEADARRQVARAAR